MRIVVTNYTGDRRNWGCQATSRNLLAFFRKVFAGKDIDISTVPLPSNHRIDHLHEAQHGDRIHRLYSDPDPEKGDLEHLEKLVHRRFGSFAKSVETADIVIFQGEGTIGPGPNLRNTLLFGLPYLASRHWGKPVLSMNQTIYARGPGDEKAIANIFSSFRMVAVREAASFGYARELGLSDVLLCPDMAFLEPGRQSSAVPVPDGPYFCVTGSAAAEQYDKAEYAKLIESIRRRTGLTPVLVYSREKDLSLKYEPSLPTVSASDYPDVSEIVPLLRSAKFVIGGRYHTSVTALSQGTPVIMLPGNTFKSEGVGPMLGIRCPVFDPGETEEILSEAEDILSDEVARRREIAGSLETVHRMYETFGEHLLEMCGCLPGRNVDLSILRKEEMAPLKPVKGRFNNIYDSHNTARRRDFSLPRRMIYTFVDRSGIWDQAVSRSLSDAG